MFVHYNLFGVEDVQSFSPGPDHTPHELSSQDSDLSLDHSKALRSPPPAMCKEILISPGML